VGFSLDFHGSTFQQFRLMTPKALTYIAKIPEFLLFWTEQDVWSWSIVSLFIFSLLIILALEGISFSVTAVLECSGRAKVSPGGRLLHRHDMADYVCIFLNKIATVFFTITVLRDLYFSKATPGIATLGNVLLPIPQLFLIYDAMYAPFHFFLHWTPVYPYIHKHHHRQVAPHRGLEDAVNTHPFEYAVGMWMHLWALQLVRDTGGVSVSPWAVLIFIFGGSLLAAFNHTRVEVSLPYVFNSLDHDTHHRFQRYNYAQVRGGTLYI